MKIRDILKQDKVTLSFEVFPPKKADGLEKVLAAAEEIAALHPDFMSVTYGAAGSTSKLTVQVADTIRKKYGVPVLPHFTCVSSTRDRVREMLREIKTAGIENALNDIIDQVNGVNDQISQIASSTAQQTTTADDMSRNLQGISDMSRMIADSSKSTVDAAEHMESLSEGISSDVDYFQQ